MLVGGDRRQAAGRAFHHSAIAPAASLARPKDSLCPVALRSLRLLGGSMPSPTVSPGVFRPLPCRTQSLFRRRAHSPHNFSLFFTFFKLFSRICVKNDISRQLYIWRICAAGPAARGRLIKKAYLGSYKPRWWHQNAFATGLGL